MFRKLVLSFIVLLLLIAVRAASQGYLYYHKRVAQAEELIITGNYNAALDIYDSLFHQYSFCFPKDCYIAAQVAAYAEAGDRCHYFLTKGFINGLSFNCLSLNPHLRKWKAADNRFGQRTLDSLRGIYEHHINSAAKQRLDDLFAADQKIVRQRGSIYTADNELEPSLKPFWDSLYREIKELTRQYGFPAEQVAGVASSATEHVTTRNAKVYYMLIHHGGIDDEFRKLLLAELDKGNIAPEMYGGIADIGRGFDTREYYSIQTCNAELQSSDCRKAVSSRLNAIDGSRSVIGLPSYNCQASKEVSRVQYYRRKNALPGKPYFDFTAVHFQN